MALLHAFLLVKKRDLDFLDPNTYWIYIQGISTLIIFTLLAITSNDWSVKRLKKNWKRLHTLTYLAMFLLTWHVWTKC
ncbi:ferric reductase-like transmembrane domain-containing protein [Nostoc sp. 'Peltigera malacea cyanobiont' DB3992]|uniref:ferric reductase-like transmembrane domain-containing protein n=1 Tax=Nostoc sp. 'Peltigera malacea cyanobiont' DB3992 TaxID=1206980 RepID=UPI0027B8DB11|nr:ferric reductase-like transmembrane domain-containing protein [Nostoc sp. 'Peltigera malacea cyanobiont' DB3992]